MASKVAPVVTTSSTNTMCLYWHHFLFNLNTFYKPGQNGVAIVKIRAEKNQLVGEKVKEVIQEIMTTENIIIQ